MEKLAAPSWKTWRAGAIVVFLTGLIFWPALGFDYVNFDDTDYVSKNLEVQKGLTWPGVIQAFHERDLKLYTPLTRLSHMLDCQLFGLAPAGHHFTNVVLHIVAAVLLLLVLWKCTGDLWTSTGCALFFSIHPLRSESVAWIAERKDVLSLALGLGAILAYACYARNERRRGFHYGLCAALMALSLLAKPMLVTLPAILLVMDLWPLQRLGDLKARIVEKLPLAALSVAAVVLLFALPGKPGDAVPASFIKPFTWRLGNACISPMVYLGQTIWPAHLGALYVFGIECPPAWQIVSCLGGIIALTWGAFRLRKSMPYVTAGWLWFLIGLLPVLGLIQMGTDRHADRYTYFPGIGLAMALGWSLRAWAVKSEAAGHHRGRVPALAVAGLVVLGSATYAQNYIWQNSETLWKATIENCGVSELAEVNLASYLQEKGRPEEAIGHAERAVQLRPYVPLAHLNLGNCLMSLHRPAEAIQEYQTTIRLDPENSEGHSNLGAAFFSIGKAREGIAETQIGLRLDPTQKKARRNLERALGSSPAS